MSLDTAFVTTAALLITLTLICTTYIKHAFAYWSRKGVPHLKPTFPYGNLEHLVGGQGIGVVSRKFYDEFKRRGCKYGGVYALTNPLFVPVDLQLVKCIMTKDWQYFSARGVYYNEKFDPLAADLFNIDGERWKRIRNCLSPNYTSGKMRTMFGVMLECAQTMCGVFRNGEAVDIKEICCCYTTDVNALCSYGFKCNSLENPSADFRTYGRVFFEANLWKEIKHFLSVAMPDVSRAIGIVTRSREVTNYFKTHFEGLIQARKTHQYAFNDLLQSLINATGRNLTQNEVLAQSLLFFIASFDTSSTTMLFCLYELARNEHIQRKLRAEIQTSVEKYGSLTYEGVTGMKYLAQVVDETMRKYPPVPTLNRECVKDYRVPESDVVIEKGTSVLIPAYGIQHDEEYFPNPEVFDPERFKDKGSVRQFAFLPFGEGPRNCIGLRFGLMQVKVGIAEAVRKYQFSVHPKTEELRVDPKSFLFRSLNKIWLNVTELNN